MNPRNAPAERLRVPATALLPDPAAPRNPYHGRNLRRPLVASPWWNVSVVYDLSLAHFARRRDMWI
eukprot:2955053-Alexandrium_andersonii.AAC.1